MTKPPMSVVAGAAETTSDKIRALLRAGYLRTEVAQFLDIRYQHVRKVAVDAGIEAGLQRGVVVLAAPKLVPKLREDVAVDVLVDAGFAFLATWIATDAGIGLSTPAPKEPGVYVFVVADLIKYVGLTRMGFHRRMYNYQRGNERQRTSHRINAVIREHVAAGTAVEIYLASPPALEWNGLPVNASAGLEAGLIEMIRPPRNKMGVEVDPG